MLSDERKRQAAANAAEISDVLTGHFTVAKSAYDALLEKRAIDYAYEVPELLAENAALRDRLAVLQNPDAYNVAVSEAYKRDVAWLFDTYAHGMIDTAKPDAAYVDRCDELTAQLQEAYQREATAQRRDAEARAVLEAVATLAVEALWTPDRRTKQRALVNTTGQTVTVIPEQARAWLAAGATAGEEAGE